MSPSGRKSKSKKKRHFVPPSPIWRFRSKGLEYNAEEVYEIGTTYFCMKLYHGGKFVCSPSRRYEGGTVDYVDQLDADMFNAHEMDRIVQELGYKAPVFYHFRIPGTDLDTGLMALGGDHDVMKMIEYVLENKEVEVYLEHGDNTTAVYEKSPFKEKGVFFEELPCDVLMISPQHNRKRRLNEGQGCSSARRILLDNEETDIGNAEQTVNLGDGVNDEVQVPSHDNIDIDINQPESDQVDDNADQQHKQGKSTDDNDDSDEDDSQDSDYEPPFQDMEHEISQVEVDMRDFRCNIDPNVEWGGIAGLPLGETPVNVDGVDALNMEELESGSSTDGDDEGDGSESKRKRSRKGPKVKYQQFNRQRDMADPQFFIGLQFGNVEDVREAIRVHSIKTRRDLHMIKNDSVRVRAICRGGLPKPKEYEEGDKEKGDNEEGETAKGDKEEGDKEEGDKAVEVEIEPCPWVLLVSRQSGTTTWQVSTYKSEHRCLQQRNIAACTSTYLANQIEDDLRTNPTLGVNAIKNQWQKKLELNISEMKAFRAKVKAHNRLIGDYSKQYQLLRDYVEELWRCIPGTTVRIDVEPCAIPHEPTRTFRRIYICLAPLRNGYKSLGRDLLGLDGAFMKGPFPGQIFSAVGVDPNNGIYPLAYAIVEGETMKSWVWFLECLGVDLDLNKDSDYTFITDRQKGLIPALAKVFPRAEHRFCLQHIYQNFKKEYRGKAYKDLIWRAATATTVKEFEAVMEELNKADPKAFDWVNKIGASHWSRSHFTGRAQCDVLYNNMCESFNKEIVQARDKPIITCLEFVREYLMKRIVKVQKLQARCTGPLCPAITIIFESVKKEAAKYTALWNGGEQYQVSGPGNDQCVVDLVHKECSCRKWELTAMPCKHAVCAIWDLGNNGGDGVPENWVHPVYRVDSWKKMYSFKVGAINGPAQWPKSQVPSVLLPPHHHVQPGRPKKARRKDPDEIESQKSQSASTQGTSKLGRGVVRLTCSKCKNPGHNARTCKGQGGETQGGSSQQNPSVPQQPTTGGSRGRGLTSRGKGASPRMPQEQTFAAAASQSTGTQGRGGQGIGSQGRGGSQGGSQGRGSQGGSQGRGSQGGSQGRGSRGGSQGRGSRGGGSQGRSGQGRGLSWLLFGNQ